MGFEPTTLRDLVGCSNHWITGDSMVSKGKMWVFDWNSDFFSELMLFLHLIVVFPRVKLKGSFHKRILSSLWNIERLFSRLKGVKTSPQNLTIAEIVNCVIFSGIPEFCF